MEWKGWDEMEWDGMGWNGIIREERESGNGIVREERELERREREGGGMG
jgi:hypothetical protein